MSHVKRVRNIPRRRRYLGASLVGLLAAIGLMVWVVSTALADAGNPILGSITGSLTDNHDGTVTISVRGQWNWLSHNSDCNLDRAGAGVGIVWNDPTEPGYLVTKGSISLGVGISKLRAGDTVNKVDQMAHPSDLGNKAEGYPGYTGTYTQTFNDPAPNPNNYASWKGGCGREPLSATDSPGPLAAANPSGASCGEKLQNSGAGSTDCAGHPWGSWGYTKAYSHTYLADQLPSKVCVNFYDVHGKNQVVNGAKEITVNGNGDNSIQTNAFNAADGANCWVPPQKTTTSTTQAAHITEHVTVKATAGASVDGQGVRVRLFKGTCVTGSEDTGTANTLYDRTLTLGTGGTVDAEVDIDSPGDYYWFVEYTGDNQTTLSSNDDCTESFNLTFPH
jgi:hypothetical protein